MREVSCGTCAWCEKPAVLRLDDDTADRVTAYLHDRRVYGPVQVEFPGLTAGQREMLISATHEVCFDEMFPDEDSD